MSCDCIDKADAKLVHHNVRLQVLILNGHPTAALIATELIEKKRGAKAPGLIPTHCPFCGVAYDFSARG